jgi:hypothetical protein
VRLRNCEFDSAIDLSSARTRDFDLGGSRLTGLAAPLAEFSGNLNISGCECSGQVVLTGAHISGALRMEDSRLRHPGEVALLANRLVVDDDLIAPRTVVDGELRLAGAQVGGIVLLDRAVLHSAGARRAVNGINLSAGLRMLARHGFTAEGEVALTGLTVRTNLDFRGSTLINPGGNALLAHGVQADGFLSFENRCSVQGAVRLSRAKISGEIYLSSGRFMNPGGDAIRCRNAEAGTLVLGPGLETDGTVDFRHSRFAVIRDDPSCWPQQLRLSGARYDALDPRLPAAERVEWLRRDTGGYLSENYETLAGMYRRHGDDTAARTVLLARERERPPCHTGVKQDELVNISANRSCRARVGSTRRDDVDRRRERGPGRAG